MNVVTDDVLMLQVGVLVDMDLKAIVEITR